MPLSSLAAGLVAPAASSVVWYFILRACVRRAYNRGQRDARHQCAHELRAWTRPAHAHGHGLAVDILRRDGSIMHLTNS